MDSNANTEEIKGNYVTIPNGEKIHYYTAGQGQKTIVLVHGLWVSGKNMSILVPFLKKDFNLIIPDLRGHGLSSYNTPINSIDDMVEDINYLLESLNIDKFHMLGACMGAPVSFRMAVLFPDKVEKLILSTPLALNGFPLYIRNREDRNIKRLALTKDDLNDYDVITGLKKWKVDKNVTAVMEATKSMVCTSRLRASEEIMLSIAEEQLKCECYEDTRWAVYTYNYTDEKAFITEGDGSARKLKCDTLLFHSVDDLLIPPITVDQYKEYLGDKLTTKAYEGAGHALIMIYTKETCEEILRWI